MRRFFRGTALALALAMILLLGGCAKEAAPPSELPAQAKTLRERGAELALELAETAGNRDYLSLYTGDTEILDLLTGAVEGKDYTSPDVVYGIRVSENALDQIFSLEPDYLESLPEELRQKVRDRFFQGLPNQLNAMNGAETLAATSICTTSRLFVDPGVTEGIIYLYTYHNGTPIAVTFQPGEDGAVSAHATFLFYDQLPIGSLEQMKGMLGALGVEITQVTGG